MAKKPERSAPYIIPLVNNGGIRLYYGREPHRPVPKDQAVKFSTFKECNIVAARMRSMGYDIAMPMPFKRAQKGPRRVIPMKCKERIGNLAEDGMSILDKILMSSVKINTDKSQP